MTEQQFNIQVGALICQARTAKGLKQGDLAKMIEVTRPTIAHIENGKYGTTCFKMGILCSVLGIDLRVLIPTKDVTAIKKTVKEKLKIATDKHKEKINKQIAILRSEVAKLEKMGAG